MRPESDALENDLRNLLNEWDPLGVTEDVQDEYDCMLGPLLELLRRGADQAKVADFLRYELEDHFGIAYLPSEPVRMATRVTSWWTEAVAPDGTRVQG
ncbi:hypothetical protein ACIP3D_14505 [Streptomyces longwoodensis]|uniref:hypothetical protein n=1 Tax=Streptomyces longwoodensis TaxID=68231 RepID=UPI00381BBAC1